MLDKLFPLYALVFFSTLAITVLAEKRLIPVLNKRATQPIYKEGPAWHMSKSGTPTMGGLAFLIAISFSLLIAFFMLLCMGETEAAYSLLISLVYAVLNALVGIIDDLTKLKRRHNAGLTPKQKLLFQFTLAVLFLYMRSKLLGDTTDIYFSFGSLDFGIFYYPVAAIILLGIVNCANLTDGIDGLASTVAFSVGAVLFFISASLFPDCTLISSAVMGASVGFLFFNLHPAKVFMGDTGSLFFGAILVSSAFALRNPLIFIFVGGIYVLEGVSVIIQVVFYKLTKKRIFKMAPLHHHLEKCGFSENGICIIAILTTLLFSIPAFIFYLP